ncbi:MAG: DUF4214 domain-containing protein [Candidatus Humimicrobiaceae bacterium]
MLKALPIISKKIMVIMAAALFAVSMALFISPGKIYGAGLVTAITVTGAGSATTVANGGTLQMYAAVLPIEAAQGVNWSVADVTGAASIDTTGVLTGTGMGTVYVIATSTDGSGVSGYLIITVTAPILVTSITVSGAAGATTVLNSSSLQMSAEVLPVDATDPSVTWSVTNGTGSATIDTSGVLTGTGVGTVTVKATANDSSAVLGTFLISVTAPPPPAAAPTASAVTITGTTQVGQTLTGSYTYYDINGDSEGTSTFRWLASDTADGTYTAITGAIAKTFLLTSDQSGKFIMFEVTPAATTGTLLTGTSAISDATAVVLAAEPPKDTSGISGTLEIKITAPSAQSSSAPMAAASVVYEKTIPGFATLFYNRILNRAPDTEGFNGWAAGLTSGALTGADLVNGFIFSEENKAMIAGDTNEQFLTTLYNLIFSRAPDAGGLKSWLANMSAGMIKEEVINHFTSSAEFISLCNEYGARP